MDSNRVGTLIDMLEEARRNRGLSRVRAAAALGTSPNNYRQWLRGQRPDWKFVDSIIDFTGADDVEVLIAIWRHGPPIHPEVGLPLTASWGVRNVDYGTTHPAIGSSPLRASEGPIRGPWSERPKDFRPPGRSEPPAA